MTIYDGLFEILHKEFDTKFCLDVLASIWENDRWFDFKSFEKTALYCRDVMNEAGLEEVELLPLRCDGETKYGDWLMPRAWDVESASLKAKRMRR